VRRPGQGVLLTASGAGDSVTKGQLLLVLEAMKMEHPLTAGIDGVIKGVQVIAGDQVRNRQVLLEIV
jgi:geranyl-CoA carboxylase alpha subunit